VRLRLAAAMLGTVVAVAACGSPAPTPNGLRTIVVTTSVLGSVVRDLVGGAANVMVLMPNGADPHEWEPSAKDIETVTHADLLVENGLGLEGGMANAFAQAEAAGVRRFVAADHVALRHVGAGEGTNPSDPDQAKGAADPHLWMDPLTVRQAMDALAAELPADLRIDVSGRQRDLDARLAALDGEVAGILSAIPDAHRTLVTGHESMGYFAQRYRLRLVGAIVPSLTSAAAPAAADLAALADQVKALGVPAIFTELGTSPDVAQALASETGARVVELATHVLPADGSYSTFMTTIAHLVADNLR
jgi:zinc/manganese transport system substrate-binding protein